MSAATLQRPGRRYGVDPAARKALRHSSGQRDAIWCSRGDGQRAIHVVILAVLPKADRVVVAHHGGLAALARWDDLALLPVPA